MYQYNTDGNEQQGNEEQRNTHTKTNHQLEIIRGLLWSEKNRELNIIMRKLFYI